MRLAFVLLLTTVAGVAGAKGRGNQSAPPPRTQPKAPPVDPAFQQFVDAARAQAPDHQTSGFHIPTAAESLIAAWKSSWDRAAVLKEHLDAMCSSHVAPAERAALFRSLYLGTASEPVLHEGIARFVRARLASDAERVLEPPPIVEAAPPVVDHP